jgi:hypothetical protein
MALFFNQLTLFLWACDKAAHHGRNVGEQNCSLVARKDKELKRVYGTTTVPFKGTSPVI